MCTIRALIAEGSQLILDFYLFKRAGLGFAILGDCVGRIAPHQNFVGDRNNDRLLSTHQAAARNCDLFRARINRGDDAADAASTPLGPLLLLFLRDIRLAHYDHLGRGHRLLIRARSPARPYTITLTNICKRDVRGTGHCLLAGCHALILRLTAKIDVEDDALIVSDDHLLGSCINCFDFADYTADR